MECLMMIMMPSLTGTLQLSLLMPWLLVCLTSRGAQYVDCDRLVDLEGSMGKSQVRLSCPPAIIFGLVISKVSCKIITVFSHITQCSQSTMWPVTPPATSTPPVVSPQRITPPPPPWSFWFSHCKSSLQAKKMWAPPPYTILLMLMLCMLVLHGLNKVLSK